MNKKNTLKKTAALLLGLTLTVGATGCSFLVTDTQKDLAQVIATVDITQQLGKDNDYKSVKDDVNTLISKKYLSTDIFKRELIANFIDTGYTYVNSYGHTYEETFNLLVDGLINSSIITQFSVAYYLKNGFEGGVAATAAACDAYVKAEQNAEGLTAKQKSLLKAHPELLAMKYFLTENGTNFEEYDKAVYTFKQMINSSLDSAEKSYIKSSTDNHTHDSTVTTPKGVDTVKEDYMPEEYEIYTGRNTLDSCGAYEKVDGGTAATRKQAYSAFLSNLQGYGLVDSSEDPTVFTELNYYYIELTATLSQALSNKYYADLQDEAIEMLKANDYKYVSDKYAEIKAAQQYAYDKDMTAFETALDNVSDDSFVLYGQKNFGFIYNILLPFSATQNQQYEAAKNKVEGDDLYNARKDILADVQAKDRRSAWFCTDEDGNYAYKVTENYYDNGANKGDTYLFFENNTVKTNQYEPIKQYLGQYPYNGKAEFVKEKSEWKFTPNKLGIGTKTQKGFIQEMENYINYAVGSDVTSGAWLDTYNETIYTQKDDTVDFSKFVYYAGKADLANVSTSNYFYAGTAEEPNQAYKALSAVNELMFAYSTDPGCLNSYMGYLVSPYKTSFVSEFEYAAQAAIIGADIDGDGVKEIEGGVGTYVVAPSDYGWHIIYVTFVYDAEDGDVYGGFKAEDVDKEGTFSYLFYESLKSTSAKNYTSEVQGKLLNGYQASATRYQSTYQDLLDME